MSKENKKNKKAFVPSGAAINMGNGKMCPPKTEYENRKKVFDRNAVKNFTKRNYGNDRSS